MESLHPIKMHLISQAFIMSDLEFTKPQPLHLYNKNNVPRPCEEGTKRPHMLLLPLSQLWAALVYIVHALFSHRQELPPRDGSSHALEYKLSVWWVDEVTLGSQSGTISTARTLAFGSGLGHSFPSNAALWNVSGISFEISEQSNEPCLTWFSQHPAPILWEHPVCWWTKRAKQTHCLQFLPFKGNVLLVPLYPHYPWVLLMASLDNKCVWLPSPIFLGKPFKLVATQCW